MHNFSLLFKLLFRLISADISWKLMKTYCSKHYAKHRFNYVQALILCWGWVLCFISAPLKLHFIVLAVAGCSSRASGRSPNLIYWLNLTFSFYVPYHTKLVIFSTIIYSCYYLRTNLYNMSMKTLFIGFLWSFVWKPLFSNLPIALQKVSEEIR